MGFFKVWSVFWVSCHAMWIYRFSGIYSSCTKLSGLPRFCGFMSHVNLRDTLNCYCLIFFHCSFLSSIYHWESHRGYIMGVPQFLDILAYTIFVCFSRYFRSFCWHVFKFMDPSPVIPVYYWLSIIISFLHYLSISISLLTPSFSFCMLSISALNMLTRATVLKFCPANSNICMLSDVE